MGKNPKGCTCPLNPTIICGFTDTFCILKLFVSLYAGYEINTSS